LLAPLLKNEKRGWEGKRSKMKYGEKNFRNVASTVSLLVRWDPQGRGGRLRPGIILGRID